jgi:hypothetical protein
MTMLHILAPRHVRGVDVKVMSRRVRSYNLPTAIDAFLGTDSVRAYEGNNLYEEGDKPGWSMSGAMQSRGLLTLIDTRVRALPNQN